MAPESCRWKNERIANVGFLEPIPRGNPGQERTVGVMTIKVCSATRSSRSTLEFTGAARIHRATFGGMMGLASSKGAGG